MKSTSMCCQRFHEITLITFSEYCLVGSEHSINKFIIQDGSFRGATENVWYLNLLCLI